MNIESHCRLSRKFFGEPFEEVHRWLDEFISRYPHPGRYRHRKHRHHKEGVDEAGRLFGHIGALVAEQHVRMDNEGWLPSKDDYNLPEYSD